MPYWRCRACGNVTPDNQFYAGPPGCPVCGGRRVAQGFVYHPEELPHEAYAVRELGHRKTMYNLTPPIHHDDRWVSLVMVSSSDGPPGPPESAMFECDRNGEPVNIGNPIARIRFTLNHYSLLRVMGYNIVEKPEEPVHVYYPTSIDVCDGKYTVIYDLRTGQAECRRYGEKWRDLQGDKMVLALFDTIVDHRRLIARLAEALGEAMRGPEIGGDAGAMVKAHKALLAEAERAK